MFYKYIFLGLFSALLSLNAHATQDELYNTEESLKNALNETLETAQQFNREEMNAMHNILQEINESYRIHCGESNSMSEEECELLDEHYGKLDKFMEDMHQNMQTDFEEAEHIIEDQLDKIDFIKDRYDYKSNYGYSDEFNKKLIIKKLS